MVTAVTKPGNVGRKQSSKRRYHARLVEFEGPLRQTRRGDK
jgi:hypothetical protein